MSPECCERCGEAFDLPPACLVEAMETFDQMLCDDCFDARCEAAWEQQEADKLSEPPVTMAEQHAAAWQQREELRRGR